MAFFPNYLRKRYQLLKQAELRTPFPEDQIPELKELIQIFQHDGIEPHFFMDTFDLDPTNEIATEVSYKIATDPELRDVLNWICKRTLFYVIVSNYVSINVHIRIGTSMLNKLVESEHISKEMNIYIHDNFVQNLVDLQCAISTEELPF